MKLMFYIIIFFSYLCSSSISLNGFGGDNTSIDPASAGLGHSMLFSGRSDGLVQSAMSTQHNSRLARIYISNNYNQLSISSVTNSNHLISSIGFSFPFRESHQIAIGLSPKTRIDFSIYQQYFDHSESLIGETNLNPLAIKHSYDFSGGISSLYLGISSGYFDIVDLGFKWDILFGNLFSDASINTYTFNYNDENCVPSSDGSFANDVCLNMDPSSSLISNNIYHFNGHSFTIDGRSVFNFHELAASITLDAPLFVNKSTINNGLAGKSELESTDDFSIGKFSCGYKFEKLSKSGITIEVQRNLSSYKSLSGQLFETQEPQSVSFHAGTFKIFENTRIGFWNYLTFSGGLMLKQINFEDYSVQDNAVTMGLGFQFLNNTNQVDISLSSGIRKTENEIFPDEEYININFAISSGDTWFKKIRRK